MNQRPVFWISSVRIRLARPQDAPVLANCWYTSGGQDTDVKLIQGDERIFVSMPIRHRTDACPEVNCQGRNRLDARYCTWCGTPLADNRDRTLNGSRKRRYSHVVRMRDEASYEYLRCLLLKGYEKELQLSQRPGYMPPKEGREYFMPTEERQERLFDWYDKAEDDASAAYERSLARHA